MTTLIYQWTFFVCCLYLVCTTEVEALPDNLTNLPPETTPSLVESPSSVLSVANVSVAVNLTVEPVVASTAGAVLKVTSSTKQSTTKPTLAPAKCPSRCKCVSIWVYCNNSGLTDVEGEFPIGTRAALLNHNKLTGLPKSTFQKVADSLVYIDFSYNQLATLKLDILFYATKLLALDLRHNQIVMTIGRLLFIPSFSNLKDLEYLNLAHNKLLFTTTQTFQSLSKLRTLILDNNQLRSSSLLDYRFAVSLQYLSLAGNKFQELKFHIETTATRLDVRDNLFNFNDTSQPFLLLKSLLDLKIGHPGVEYFPKTFTGLSSLKEIYFEKLSQAVLDNKILAPIIPSLKNFTVIGGNVSTISLFNFRSLANVNLFNLSRLETLQLRSMPIGDLPKIKLGNVTSLKYVKFVRLGFTTFKVDSQFPAGVKNLSLNSNKLKSLSANNLNSFSNLHHVDLGYNRIANVDNQTFSGFAYIQVVILSGNLLDRIDSFFLESPTLKRLDLSRNFISFISSKAFAKLPAIEAIDLSHNEIQSLPRISLSSIAAPQLVVQGNTWNCTCELYRQVKESNNYSVFCNSDLATMDCFVCSSPSNLFNKALSSLESVCKTKPRPTPTPTPLNTNFVIPLVCVLSVLIIIIFAILVWRFRCKQPRKATVRAPQLVFKQDATYEAVLYTAPPLKAGHAANTRLTNPYVFGNEADDKANAEMQNAYVLASETHQGKLQSGDDSSLPGNLYITANDAKTENVIDQKIPHDPYSVAKDPANSTGQPMAAQNPYVMASTKADNPYELPIAQPKVEYLTFDG